MTGAGFSKHAALGRAPKSDQQLPVGASNDGRKGTVKLLILVDDYILLLANVRRSRGNGRRAEDMCRDEDKAQKKDGSQGVTTHST
jgi:hypothetical protein